MKYMCAKNCHNRRSSDKVIAKIKWCSFLPHMVYIYIYMVQFFCLTWYMLLVLDPAGGAKRPASK